MSDRRDSGPLRLPPEREVTPQLRARVLHQAMQEDRKPERRPTRIVPAIAGLAAAAVVVGVVYTVSQDGGGDEGGSNAANTGLIGQPVATHDVVETVLNTVPDAKVQPIKMQCQEATGVVAKYRMTTQLLRSPVGRIHAGGYGQQKSTHPTRIFCTPFATVVAGPSAIVTAQEPVRVIAGSRVQGLLPTRNETDNDSAYYDGAWFAVTSSVKAIEVRLIIDGEPQIWHQALSSHAYVFASTWAQLTQDQLDSGVEVTVEYRAISTDDTLMPIPAAIKSTTVTPADTPELNSQRDVFPPLAQ